MGQDTPRFSTTNFNYQPLESRQKTYFFWLIQCKMWWKIGKKSLLNRLHPLHLYVTPRLPSHCLWVLNRYSALRFFLLAEHLPLNTAIFALISWQATFLSDKSAVSGPACTMNRHKYLPMLNEIDFHAITQLKLDKVLILPLFAPAFICIREI